MASFGQNLRREREMRGISLDDMARSTKIGTRLLKALEDEQFDLLPGGIFNKGFVRAYAKYLGIDDEAALSAYLEAAGQQEMDVRLIAEQNSKWDKSSSALDSGVSRSGGFPIVPVLILVVVVAAGFGGWRIYQQRQQKTEQTEAATAQGSAPTQPAAGTSQESAGAGSAQSAANSAPASSSKSPTAAVTQPPASTTANPSANNPSATNSRTSGTEASDTAKQAAGMGSPFATPSATVPGAASSASPGTTPDGKTVATGPFEVSIHTKDRAWVSIKIDGDIQTRGVLPPNETRNFHANSQIVLWTGNAGAVDVAYNGKSVPLEGGANDVKVLVFTPKGVAPGVIPKPRPPATTLPQPEVPEAKPQPTASTPPQQDVPEAKPQLRP